MGAYLSKPVTDKESITGGNKWLSYGASCMQGWRYYQEGRSALFRQFAENSMKRRGISKTLGELRKILNGVMPKAKKLLAIPAPDAHNCITDFDSDIPASFFAVYDGHGGPEVAQYCSQKLPSFLKTVTGYLEGNYSESLVEAFLGMDSSLCNEEVKAELKILANDDGPDSEEDEDEDASALRAEADMPLEDVLKKYGGTDTDDPQQLKSLIRRCKNACKNDEENAGEGPSSSEPLSSDQLAGLAEGENDNNRNIELEQAVSNSTDAETAVKTDSVDEKGDTIVKENGVDLTDNEKIISKKGDLEKKDVSIDNDDDEDDKDYLSGEDESDEEENLGDEENSGDEEENSGDEEENSGDEDEGENEDMGEMSRDLLDDKCEPGSDSGTTAVVALLCGQKLYVANAGDSRCVLSQNGKAVDMSVDHKPEDPDETARIKAAGGSVSKDGRVNGGLNLSRAIGDHVYKAREDLDLKAQMITALPDIQEMDLKSGEYDFMVLACDGIWNSLTSQEVVDFIRPKIKAGEDLSKICEQLFDSCLSPDTSGDGTGCDNMTCIVVSFLDLEGFCQASRKRRVSNGSAERDGLSCKKIKKNDC